MNNLYLSVPVGTTFEILVDDSDVRIFSDAQLIGRSMFLVENTGSENLLYKYVLPTAEYTSGAHTLRVGEQAIITKQMARYLFHADSASVVLSVTPFDS